MIHPPKRDPSTGIFDLETLDDCIRRAERRERRRAILEIAFVFALMTTVLFAFAAIVYFWC